MANDPIYNISSQYDPNTYHGTVPQMFEQKAQRSLDPFNITGWNQQTYDVAPQPGQPGYQPGYDPNTMAFAPELAQRLNGINLNTQGLDQLRKEALRKKPSAWMNIQSQKQFLEEANQKDKAVTQARTGQRQGEADLAASGGLSTGARERLARKSSSDLLAMSQDTSRQGNLNQLQLGINDEQNRITQLSQLPGMETQAFSANLAKENQWDTAKQADTQRLIQENNQRNSYNQSVYNQQMQAWAANRQAQATENSGKK